MSVKKLILISVVIFACSAYCFAEFYSYEPDGVSGISIAANFNTYENVKSDPKVKMAVKNHESLISDSKNDNNILQYYSTEDGSEKRISDYIANDKAYFAKIETISYESVLFLDDYLLISLEYTAAGKRRPWVEFYHCRSTCKLSNYPASNLLRAFNLALKKSKKLANKKLINSGRLLVFSIGMNGVKAAHKESAANTGNELKVILDWGLHSICIDCALDEKADKKSRAMSASLNNFVKKVRLGELEGVSAGQYALVYGYKDETFSSRRTEVTSYLQELSALEGRASCVSFFSSRNFDDVFCKFIEKDKDASLYSFQINKNSEVVFPVHDLGLMQTLKNSKSFLNLVSTSLEHGI